MFRDEAWDIILMVLVLGIVIPITLGLILPMMAETKELVYDEIMSKSAVGMQGEQFRTHDTFDGGYTYEQAIALLSKQSYFMPEPRILNIGGQYLSVAADTVNPNIPASAEQPGSKYEDDATLYVPNNLNTMIVVQKYLSTWCQQYSARYGENGYKLKFICQYDVAEDEGEADDRYSVFVLGYADGKPQRFLCEPNGIIKTIPNKTCYVSYFD